MRLPRGAHLCAFLFALLLAGACVFGASESARPVSRRSHKLGAGVAAAAAATAYCQAGITRSGVDTHSGIAAADPSVLPVGSVIHVTAPDPEYSGIYMVLDTGRRVQGRIIDLFVDDCREATRFGRQKVTVVVLRHGWDPHASAKTMVALTAEQ